MPRMVDDFHRGTWNSIDAGSCDSGRTTQRPAIRTTGPFAENYGPLSSLVSDCYRTGRFLWYLGEQEPQSSRFSWN